MPGNELPTKFSSGTSLYESGGINTLIFIYRDCSGFRVQSPREAFIENFASDIEHELSANGISKQVLLELFQLHGMIGFLQEILQQF